MKKAKCQNANCGLLKETTSHMKRPPVHCCLLFLLVIGSTCTTLLILYNTVNIPKFFHNVLASLNSGNRSSFFLGQKMRCQKDSHSMALCDLVYNIVDFKWLERLSFTAFFRIIFVAINGPKISAEILSDSYDLESVTLKIVFSFCSTVIYLRTCTLVAYISNLGLSF